MPFIIDAFIIDTTIPNPGWADVNAFTEIIAIVGHNTWDLIQAKKKLKVDWVEIEYPRQFRRAFQRLVLTSKIHKEYFFVFLLILKRTKSGF